MQAPAYVVRHGERAWAFVGGDPPRELLPALRKPGARRDAAERAALSAAYGPAAATADAVLERLWPDDRLAVVRAKIAAYLDAALERRARADGVYLWAECALDGSRAALDGLAAAMMQGEARVGWRLWQRRWRWMFAGPPPPTPRIVELEDAQHALAQAAPAFWRRPLTVAYRLAHAQGAVPLLFDPVPDARGAPDPDFVSPTGQPRALHAEVPQDARTLESFCAVDNVLRLVLAADLPVAPAAALHGVTRKYVPLRAAPSVGADLRAGELRAVDAALATTWELAARAGADAGLTSLTLESATGGQRGADLMHVFQAAQPSRAAPFLRLSWPGGALYKLHADVRGLAPELLAAWTAAGDRDIALTARLRVDRPTEQAPRWLQWTLAPDLTCALHWQFAWDERADEARLEEALPALRAWTAHLNSLAALPGRLEAPRPGFLGGACPAATGDAALWRVRDLQLVGDVRSHEGDASAPEERLAPLDAVRSVAAQLTPLAVVGAAPPNAAVLALRYTRVDRYSAPGPAAHFIAQHRAAMTSDELAAALQRELGLTREAAAQELAASSAASRSGDWGAYVQLRATGSHTARVVVRGCHDLRHARRALGLAAALLSRHAEMGEAAAALASRTRSGRVAPAAVWVDEDDDDDAPAVADWGAPAAPKSGARSGRRKSAAADREEAARSYVLNRLKAADPEVFQKGQYARRCTAHDLRQPIALSAQQKARIDAAHAGSYGSALRFRDHFYICPARWCPLSEVSLRDDERGCPRGERPILFRSSFWGHTPASGRHAYMHSKAAGCAPCCYTRLNKATLMKSRQCGADNVPAAGRDESDQAPRYVVNAAFVPVPLGRLGAPPAALAERFRNGRCVGTDGRGCVVRLGVPQQADGFLRAALRCVRWAAPDGDPDEDSGGRELAAVAAAQLLSSPTEFVLSGLSARFDAPATPRWSEFRAWFARQTAYHERFRLGGLARRVAADAAGARRAEPAVLRQRLLHAGLLSFLAWLADEGAPKAAAPELVDLINAAPPWLNPRRVRLVVLRASPDGALTVRALRGDAGDAGPVAFLLLQDKYAEPLALDGSTLFDAAWPPAASLLAAARSVSRGLRVPPLPPGGRYLLDAGMRVAAVRAKNGALSWLPVPVPPPHAVDAAYAFDASPLDAFLFARVALPDGRSRAAEQRAVAEGVYERVRRRVAGALRENPRAAQELEVMADARHPAPLDWKRWRLRELLEGLGAGARADEAWARDRVVDELLRGMRAPVSGVAETVEGGGGSLLFTQEQAADGSMAATVAALQRQYYLRGLLEPGAAEADAAAPGAA
jgi:hypothetical protein